MAASDALAQLSKRAKIAEDHVEAAKTQARSEVQAQVDKARNTAQQKADGLRTKAAQDAAEVSQWWTDMQRSWSNHMTQIRRDVEGKKAKLDTKMLLHRAEVAESDALAAVAFAEAALQEAEYAVLDATLAKMDAEVAQAGK